MNKVITITTMICKDYNASQVVRHYHGHLSGVYDLSLHPTIDVLVTCGRDASARVSHITIDDNCCYVWISGMGHEN